MKNTFRTAAVGGFNRQDVTEYITKTAAETAETIRLLEQERDDYAAAAAEKEQLSVEIANLREWLGESEAALEQERAERERLSGADEEKKALEEKVAALEEQAAEYRQLKDHIAQVELDARKRSEELLAQADKQAKELLAAAKAQAEELLAKTAAEVGEARAALRGHVQSAAADFALLQKDLDVMKTHLTSELRKMDVALSQLPLAFNKVSAEIKELEKKVSE